MSRDYNENVYLFALNEINSIGPYRQAALVKKFGSAKAVFEADASLFYQLNFLNHEQIQSILSYSQFEHCHGKIQYIQNQGIQIVNFQDPKYPKRLLEIACFPTLLFYRGDLNALQANTVLGIVGSRKMTKYGEQVIQEMMQPLVSNNVLIVSGMAFGVDIKSHLECLHYKGKTVAVQAQGVDKGYPRSHQKTYDAIISSGGCIISEFPFLEEGGNEKFLFPRRNRLISGLSDGVLIVEAKERSGALITARFALEQNRDVMAVPGGIYQEMSRGCLKLINQGAKAVIDVDDVLCELGLLEQKQEKRTPVLEDDRIPVDLFESPLENRIFVLCQSFSKTLDDIIDDVAEPVPFVSATVTKMQLMGRLKEVDGKRFVSVE